MTVSSYDQLRQVRRGYQYYKRYQDCLRVFEYHLDAELPLSEYELSKIVFGKDTFILYELKRRFPVFFRLLSQYRRLFIMEKVFSRKILKGHYKDPLYPLVIVPKTPLPLESPAE